MLHNQLHTMYAVYTAYALSTMYTLSFTASSLQDTGTHNHNTCLIIPQGHMWCANNTCLPAPPRQQDPKLNIHILWGNDLLPGCKTCLRSSSVPSIHLAISCAKTVNNRTVFKPRDILETTRLNSNLRLRVQEPEA